jgi:hypothetical protein
MLPNPSEKRVEQMHHLATHGPLGPIFYLVDKANIIADCVEIQFRSHDLCDCDYREHARAQVEALFATVQ